MDNPEKLTKRGRKTFNKNTTQLTLY